MFNRKKISDQDYALLLLPHIKVHNVFHVSLLKKYVPDANHILGDEVNLVSEDRTLDVSPERILQSRERVLRNRTIMEHLIKWTGYKKRMHLGNVKTLSSDSTLSLCQGEDTLISFSWGGCKIPKNHHLNIVILLEKSEPGIFLFIHSSLFKDLTSAPLYF